MICLSNCSGVYSENGAILAVSLRINHERNDNATGSINLAQYDDQKFLAQPPEEISPSEVSAHSSRSPNMKRQNSAPWLTKLVRKKWGPM